MLLEIGSSVVMAGIAGVAYLKSSGNIGTNDKEKIEKIFVNAGWVKREGEIRIQRRQKIDGGMEYVFQTPLGFDRKKIENNRHVLEDGLNIRHKFMEFDPRDILKIKWDRTAIKQIKKILTSKKIARKEIDVDFDGMLKIRVYDKPMSNDIKWHESQLNPGKWSVTLGLTREKNITHDFDKYKHLIIAGSTGYGKSAVLKLIIMSLLLQQSENAHFHLIDLKGGSAFKRFENLKQVDHFTHDPKEAKDILKEIRDQMDREYLDIVNKGFEDVIEAGIQDRHFIIIDEAADIADDPGAMEAVIDITRKGRGAGYYLIYATQYPSSQSIPQQVKRNIPSRLCFVLDDAIASNTALGQTGAEDLPLIPGRGIYKNIKTQVIQTPYVTNKEIEKRIGPHIVFKSRKDDQDNEQKPGKTTTDRKHSLIITKT